MKAASHLLLLLCALPVLTACGTPGAPQPPSLELPRTVQDLTATRKGEKVTLTWTPPTQTTDGQNIRTKYAGPQVICRAVEEFRNGCAQRAGEVPLNVPAPAKGQKKPVAVAKRTFVDTMPKSLQENPDAFAVYAVEARNWHGRSAGLSNQVRVPLAPTAPAPAQPEATVTADAVRITYCFQGGRDEVQLVPRVFRQEKGSTAPASVVSGETNVSRDAGGCSRRAETLDRNFEWEKSYTYWATVVTEVMRDDKRVAEVEGEDSAPVTVLAHDVFPPAVPQGLEAVAAGVGQKPAVDLTWTPDTDADLAGYNVYREQAGGEWAKINAAMVTTPAYRDANVVSGQAYAYAVSAVDVRGNESGKSAPAREAVQ